MFWICFGNLATEKIELEKISFVTKKTRKYTKNQLIAKLCSDYTTDSNEWVNMNIMITLKEMASIVMMTKKKSTAGLKKNS